MSGSLNEGNLFEGLQLVDYKSFVGFIKDQLGSPCNSDAELNEYSVANVLTNIPIATYRLQLSARYPWKNEGNSLLSYDPKEMEIFGEDLKKRLMEELKVIMNLQERSIQGILEASLMKNKGLLRVSQILKIFEDDLQKCLEGGDWRNEDDLLKLHDDLKARALSSLPKKGELGGSGGETEGGVLLELAAILEKEIEKRKPGPEEVWRRKAVGIIGAVRAKHREYLELAKDDNLDKAHASFREIAFLKLNSENPFPSNPPWKKKLDKKVNEKLDTVLAEVRNERQRTVTNNEVPGNQSRKPIIIEIIEIKEEEDVLASEHLSQQIVSPLEAGPGPNSEWTGNEASENSRTESADETLLQGGVIGEVQVRAHQDSKETAMLEDFVEEKEPGGHELDVEIESSENLENESSSPDESGDSRPMREKGTEKREANSKAGESSQTSQSKSVKSQAKRARKAKPYLDKAKWHHHRCLDCCYRPSVFAGDKAKLMFLHRTRHHLEKLFPEEEHKERFLTDRQYQMVLYHLLFKNMVTKVNTRKGGLRRWRCTLCLEAGPTAADSMFKVKLHAIRKHFPRPTERLKQVQNDPDLEAKLKRFENDGKLCPCGVYMTKINRAVKPGYKYHLKFCKLAKGKKPGSVAETRYC